jgi:protein O-GlcNAc transferase
VTFGCLNSFAKASPAALDLWAQVLASVPDSRLILHCPSGSHRENVKQRFAKAGVGGDRIEFVSRQPVHQYFQTYNRIDIALDPFPYGGGITTCDALWMGVPVVTLSGRTAVGRGGRSVLSNVGLPEFIAYSPERYRQVALAHAGDLTRLAESREGLRERLLRSPLMDAANFARGVENAYRTMWQTWRQTR